MLALGNGAQTEGCAISLARRWTERRGGFQDSTCFAANIQRQKCSAVTTEARQSVSEHTRPCWRLGTGPRPKDVRYHWRGGGPSAEGDFRIRHVLRQISRDKSVQPSPQRRANPFPSTLDHAGAWERGPDRRICDITGAEVDRAQRGISGFDMFCGKYPETKVFSRHHRGAPIRFRAH